MVADIRGFTELAQHLDSDTLSRVTGALFREAGTVLRDRGAWGQKYIGDAVMAIWLHSACMHSDVLKIIGSLAKLAEIAAGLQARFELDQPIRIGAGLNTGLASLGNVGSEFAPDFTALGDAVNRAFRLESAAKAANWDVALGEETYRLAESLPEVRGLFQRSTLQLKGYTEPVTAWGASFGALLPALVRLNQEAPEK